MQVQMKINFFFFFIPTVDHHLYDFAGTIPVYFHKTWLTFSALCFSSSSTLKLLHRKPFNIEEGNTNNCLIKTLVRNSFLLLANSSQKCGEAGNKDIRMQMHKRQNQPHKEVKFLEENYSVKLIWI